MTFNKANFVNVNLACEKLLKRFQFPSRFAMIFTWLLLPLLAVGQVSVVQVTSNPFSSLPHAASNMGVSHVAVLLKRYFWRNSAA